MCVWYAGQMHAPWLGGCFLGLVRRWPALVGWHVLCVCAISGFLLLFLIVGAFYHRVSL